MISRAQEESTDKRFHIFSVFPLKKKKERGARSLRGALCEPAAVRTTTVIQMENASRSPCCSYRFWLSEGGWAELGEFGTCMARVCKVSNLAALMMRNVEWHCDQNRLPRSGTYSCSFFLYSVHVTWFLRGPNTRGNKCLSVKESGKQYNKGGRDLKKILLLSYPQLRRAWCFLLLPAVPSAFGFNQVQGRNSTSCCLALIRRSQILQIGRFLLLVFLIWWIICFKVFGKGHYRGSGPSLLLLPSLFITAALRGLSRLQILLRNSQKEPSCESNGPGTPKWQHTHKNKQKCDQEMYLWGQWYSLQCRFRNNVRWNIKAI